MIKFCLIEGKRKVDVFLARFVQEVNLQFYALKSEGSVVMEILGCRL